MTIFLTVVAAAFLGLFIVMLLKSQRLQKLVTTREAEIVAVKQESAGIRQHYEGEALRIHNEAQTAISSAQQLVDQQLTDLKQETERIRQHYDNEARRSQEAAEALIAKTLKELEPLRKYESLRDTGTEIERVLTEATTEATALRKDAQTLLEQSRTAAADERTKATQRAKEIRIQADALLDRATLDAGRIVEEATKRAEQIGGDAYVALRDKQTLEEAVKALWNVTDGYGDRYVIPTRSVLDDLATDFGHTEAGEALKAAREHSRRMVEQKQAAACNYVETDRRDRANRFVVDAFNGRVDAILSRTKHDNYGTLEQELRDAFSLVNLNGLAFRDARILPAYLDARLTELKWAVVVQELKLKAREEQRRIQEQMREEEKVRRERERAIQEAQKEEDVRREAREAVQKQMEKTIQELKDRLEKANGEQRSKLEQEFQEQMGRLTTQLQEKDEKLREAEEKKQREISMAQLTRAGNVYIISNIGSFGEEVFKIGMTRRRDPMDRIWELGDASVPFDFDVHAMIYSEDAPAMERLLHDAFDDLRINKVNYRKEFFRLPLERIKEVVASKGLNTAFTLVAEAREFRETQALDKMTPEEREKYHLRQNGDDSLEG